MAERVQELVDGVRELAERRIEPLLRRVGAAEHAPELAPGKMLRTRLAARLAHARGAAADLHAVTLACAATELVHAASLCHDDVIDGARRRRGGPALWCRVGTPAAILIGDMLLAEAFDLVAAVGNPRMVRAFSGKVAEVSAAEAEQELLHLDRELSPRQYLRLARLLTGPLFAFPAGVCADGDRELEGPLQECGYRVGTAYQVADDLLDVAGSQETAGKTLGTDAGRGKFTPVGTGPEGRRQALDRVGGLCRKALGALEGHRGLVAAARTFLLDDLLPVLEHHLGPTGLREALTDPADETPPETRP